MRSTIRFAIAAAFAAAGLTAQQPAAGQDAPALRITAWLKGEPVGQFRPGHVYVVAFWAVGCGDSVDSIQHLSRLQQRHRGALTVIGVTAVGNDNPRAAVAALVAAQGERMAYTVALDDAGQTTGSWLEAAQQAGLPACFVVDQRGAIAWSGHPMWLDVALPPVFAGDCRPAALAERLAALERRLASILLSARERPASAVEAAAALAAEVPSLAGHLDAALFEPLLDGDAVELASPIGERLVARAIAREDAAELNAIAWGIVDPLARRKGRDLELAGRAARKANDLTAGGDASILDTLARVCAWQGDFAQAHALQQQAIQRAGDDEQRAALEPALREYARLAPRGGR